MQKGKLEKLLSNVKSSSSLITYLKEFLSQPPIKQRKEHEDILIDEFEDFLKTKKQNPGELLNSKFLEIKSEEALFFVEFIKADNAAIKVTEQKQSPYRATFFAATKDHVLLEDDSCIKLELEKIPGSGEFIATGSIDISKLESINCIAARHDGSFLVTQTAHEEEILILECKRENPENSACSSITPTKHIDPTLLGKTPDQNVWIQDIASLDNNIVVALGIQLKLGYHLSCHTLGTHVSIFSADGTKQLKTWKTDVSTVAVTFDNRVITGSGYVTQPWFGSNYWTGTITVWDQNGKSLKSWNAPTQYLTTAGNLIVSYGTVGYEDSKEGLVSIWDPETGEKLKCFPVPRIKVEDKFKTIDKSQIPPIIVRGNLLFVGSQTYKWSNPKPDQKSASLRGFFFSNISSFSPSLVEIIEGYLGDEVANPTAHRLS